MAKPDLKVVAADTAERAALAAALAHADAAAKSLSEAEAASDNALEKLGAAFREQEDLERLHRDVGRNGAATPAYDHGRLIAALAGGSDVEAPAPPPDRLGEVTQQLAAAESEIKKWRALRAITGQEVDARRVMLESARREVQKAANEVVAAGVDVASIIESTTANISLLWQLNVIAPGDARLHAFFNGVTVMNQSDALRRPSAQRLRDFRDALMHDADAAAPSE
jgi:hypothetical protein